MKWAESLDVDAVEDEEKTTLLTQQLALLRKSYSTNTSNRQAYYRIGLIAAGSSDLASEAKQVFDIENLSSSSLSSMGTSDLRSQNYERGIFYLKLAIEKDPEGATSINNLAYIYSLRDKPMPDNALALVDKALELIGDGSSATYYHDTRARVLIRLERYPEAIESFEKSLASRPNYPNILFGLMHCYEAMNDEKAELYRAQLVEIESKIE